MKLKVKAHGKINWTLDILGQRPDGYHDLDMLISSVSLCDNLEFQEADDLEMFLISNNGSRFVPGDEKNLVLQSARALQEATGVARGASIKLQKFIPVSAGMGGGSSDAAATLVALNRLWNCRLCTKELSEIGLTIGADVPYCIEGGLARVQGIGEKVTKLKMGRELYLIIIQPCRGLSTKEVFGSYHSEGHREQGKPDNEAAQAALLQGDLRALAHAMGNVLEPVSVEKRPKMAKALEALRLSGALRAQMTGSGSVVYGVYQNAYKCRKALMQLQEEYPDCLSMRTTDTGIEIVEEGE